MAQRRKRGLAGSRPFKMLVFLLVAVLTFVLVEGLSGTVIFLYDCFRVGVESMRYYSAPESRRHAQYDETLGWVAIPGLDLPDLYGKGRYLRTDQRGFRSDREIGDVVPPGKVRFICSGDSFTFGQGVANDRTWCALLTDRNRCIESVNMGQRGYGVDQAYLWYMRDGGVLDHSVHIFAFISGDFARMKRSAHHGYGKPVLTLEDGELLTTNVPVPRRSSGSPWVSRVRQAVARLRSVELARRAMGPHDHGLGRESDSDAFEVALEIFQSLTRTNDAKDSLLVLLWLPVESEIYGGSSRWRTWVTRAAAESDLLFIDLTPDLRELPPQVAESFFIREDDASYLDSAGHYNERGHAWVADRLYEHLISLPQVREPLERCGAPGAP